MDYRRTYLKDLLSGPSGVQASAFGWVKTRRDSKGVSFLQLSDGSSFKDLQVVIEAGTLSEEALRRVSTGACVQIDGLMVDSPGEGQSVELKANSLTVFGEADAADRRYVRQGI